MRHVARFEWRMLRARGSTWLMLGLLVFFMAYGLYNGRAIASQQDEAKQAIVAQQQARLGEAIATVEAAVIDTTVDATAAEDPGTIGWLTSLVLPTQPLAALAVGQSDMLPYSYGVGVVNKQRMPQDRYGYENPLHLLMGRFDLALFVIVLLPLLIIAFSYNILSKEREQGTLAMLLANPVTLHTVLWGKVVPRFALLLGGLLGCAFIGLVALGVDVLGNAGMLLLWGTLVLTYGAFWFVVAVAVNTRGTGSATHALVLVGAWIGFVIVLPAVLHVAASALYPVPSRIEAVNAARANPMEFLDDLPRLANAWYERYPDLETEQWNAQTVVQSFGSGFDLVQAEMDFQAAPVEARIEAQIGKQQQFVRRFGWLSPAIVVREAMNDLAGNGAPHHHRFREQVEAFRITWRRFFIPRLIHQAEMTTVDYETLPHFVFSEEPPSALVTRLLWGIGAVMAWVLALGWRAVRAFRRYPAVA